MTLAPELLYEGYYIWDVSKRGLTLDRVSSLNESSEKFQTLHAIYSCKAKQPILLQFK